MSHSNKARHGTRTKKWKDSVGKSRSQARSRAKWKKVKKNTKRPAHGSMRGKRQPKSKPPSFGILTATGIYDPKTKTIEPYDDDDDSVLRRPELTMEDVKHNMLLDLRMP